MFESQSQTNRTITMRYRRFTQTDYGWELVQESPNRSDFDTNDEWAFSHLETTGCEYVKMGDTMWDISYPQPKTAVKQSYSMGSM